jgi:potassium-transporting ATPase KdpC subunit
LSSTTQKRSAFRPIIVLAILSFLVCGLVFPLVVTGIAQVAFPYQANGSLAQVGCRTVGSYDIDNGFTLPIFFHARNETNALTASASGVDPDIPLADALAQVPRISNATGISTQELALIVDQHVENTLWIFGDSYVNVLSVNVALINQFGNMSVYAPYYTCPH